MVEHLTLPVCTKVPLVCQICRNRSFTPPRQIPLRLSRSLPRRNSYVSLDAGGAQDVAED